MGLRPGKCYRSKKDRAYTRIAVTVPSRNYIGATPGVKTRQFNMGNPAKDFTHILDLVVDDAVQIRDNAIESARIAINRALVNRVGKDAFFMRIRVYPYHILRENKQAQGAHADRIQQGMSHAFGKPIGRAVRVRPGQKVMSVLVDKPFVEETKKILLRAKSKFPCDVHVEMGTDVASIGTRPKEIKEIVIEEAAKEVAAEKEKEGEEKEAGKEKAGKEKKEEGKKEKEAGKKEGKK